MGEFMVCKLYPIEEGGLGLLKGMANSITKRE